MKTKDSNYERNIGARPLTKVFGMHGTTTDTLLVIRKLRMALFRSVA